MNADQEARMFACLADLWLSQAMQPCSALYLATGMYSTRQNFHYNNQVSSKHHFHFVDVILRPFHFEASTSDEFQGQEHGQFHRRRLSAGQHRLNAVRINSKLPSPAHYAYLQTYKGKVWSEAAFMRLVSDVEVRSRLCAVDWTLTNSHGPWLLSIIVT